MIKRWLYYDSKFLEWLLRILFTFNIVMPGWNFQGHYYPLDVLLMTLIAFWLYIYRLKVPAVLFLFLATLINYQNIGMPYHGD